MGSLSAWFAAGRIDKSQFWRAGNFDGASARRTARGLPEKRLANAYRRLGADGSPNLQIPIKAHINSDRVSTRG